MFHPSLCMCMAWAYTSTHACACMWGGGQRTMSCCLPLPFSHLVSWDGLSLNLGLAYSIAWSWPASTRAPPASASSELGLQAHSHMYLTYYISAGDQTGAIMLAQQMPNQLSHHPSSTLLTLNLIYIKIEKHMFVVPWLGSRSTFIRTVMVLVLIPTI